MMRKHVATDQDWMPNVLITGAPKSGTSSLHLWLADHPEVSVSIEKETYFFVDPGTHMFHADQHVSRGLDTYRDCFPDIPKGAPKPKIILESTPSYLYSETALQFIPDLPSRPLLLFILREPSAQIFSLFKYFSNNWNFVPANMTFTDFLAAVESGGYDFGGNELAQNAIRFADYRPFLTRWIERCGRERVKIYLFEDLRENPRLFARKICFDLGIDAEFYDTYHYPKDNETYRIRDSGIQRLNIAIRNHLPRGAVYDWLRNIYRTVNTRRPDPMSAEDKDALAALRKKFEYANQALEATVGISTKQWR